VQPGRFGEVLGDAVRLAPGGPSNVTGWRHWMHRRTGRPAESTVGTGEGQLLDRGTVPGAGCQDTGRLHAAVAENAASLSRAAMSVMWYAAPDAFRAR
jgi:hypothetical protein